MAAENRYASDIEELMTLKAGELNIAQKIEELMGKIGEKLEISAYQELTGEKVISYVHANSKLGVMVALKDVNGTDVTDAGKDVAMQTAAMNPVAVDKDDVPQDVVDKEVEIGKEQARAEGKPENLVEKIAVGKLNKFIKTIHF